MVLAFHDHRLFCGERARVCATARIHDSINLFPYASTAEQRLCKHHILAWFDAVTYERVGVLRGEYVLFQHGMALMDRNGQLILIGSASDDAFVVRFEERMSVIDASMKTNLLERWDQLSLRHDVIVHSDRFGSNYWHLTTESMPRARLYESYGADHIVVPANHLTKTFQRDLFTTIFFDKQFFVVGSDVVRVRNPILAFTPMSTEGILWLRRKMNLAVSNGDKRYYIRRGHGMARTQSGGGLAEEARLMRWLDHFGFQVVDFGEGDLPVHAQIQMLAGARIVLASHGAHLTNIVYLNPPLTVIEIFGPTLYNASYVSIANMLSFEYYGIAGDVVDEAGDIVVDCEQLDAIMEEVLR